MLCLFLCLGMVVVIIAHVFGAWHELPQGGNVLLVAVVVLRHNVRNWHTWLCPGRGPVPVRPCHGKAARRSPGCPRLGNCRSRIVSMLGGEAVERKDGQEEGTPSIQGNSPGNEASHGETGAFIPRHPDTPTL